MDYTIRGPVRPCGEIRVNGDKSITHRGLILGGLARGRTTLRGFSRGRDCLSTLAVLRRLGVDAADRDGRLAVEGRGRFGLREPGDVLDCGNSGTTIRLFTGVLAGQDFFSVLTGDASLRKRPMERVTQPLIRMGADIRGRAKGRCAPLAIRGQKLTGLAYDMPVASAQVKSAVLLAGLHAEDETVVRETVLTRDHTERMMAYLGADIRRTSSGLTRVSGRSWMTGREIDVPGDISSAAFFIALAAISDRAEIRINGVGVNPNRTGILDCLKSMGADIVIANPRDLGCEPVADLIVRHAPLKAVTISGGIIPRVIDEIPVLAVCATQAEGTTLIRDAGELRVKESDRIKAIAEGLRKMGAVLRESPDGLAIEGPVRLKAADCASFDDHRICLALTVAGLIAEGETVIRDADCVAISFPEFPEKILALAGPEILAQTAENDITEKKE
jgi:3-phosphoshikimate 1-carboxyvinyltransferase